MGRVATKRVKLVCGDRSEEVDALVTTAGEVSAISDRLAAKLNITQWESVEVDNFGMKATVYMPSSAAQVIVPCKVNSVEDQIATPIAFLVIPDFHHEIVLGIDWLNSLQTLSGARMMLNYRGDEDPNITKEGKWIFIGTGYPTPGPSFVPNVESICHLLEVRKVDRAKLNALSGGTKP